jgi:predicted amidophosphoribosyltransferase
LSEEYCYRCGRDIYYIDTYINLCRICEARVYDHVPNYIPDEQIEKFKKLWRLKNV